MGIDLTGLRIADIGVDQVEEGSLLIVLEMFQITEPLQGLFIEALIEAFVDQVIDTSRASAIFLAASMEGEASPRSYLPIMTWETPLLAARSPQLGGMARH